MAGDWIKMTKTLPRDPRVVRISSALKADRFRTVGGLMSVWSLADDLTEDGRLDSYNPELLDELVGFPGIARAMESVGWLIIGPDFLEFPRFEEHNGKSAKRRAQDAVRKMSAREADKCPGPERTKSGPEKRREENSNLPSKPQGFPSQADAIAYAASSPTPISQECAIAFWDTQEAGGWVTKHGHPIADWRAALRRYASHWNENLKTKAPAPTGHREQRRAAEYPEPNQTIPLL